ncbi:hypothetical protein DFH29DRAFT_1010413 [Suillus ampliporus]|nr:hypothetical protein DFH29DRAFT_1010413 [Suillus ampliporus]
MSSQSFRVTLNHPPSPALLYHCKLMTLHLTTLPPSYDVSAIATGLDIFMFPCLPRVIPIRTMIYAGTQSAVHVRHLAISSSTTAGDALALSASWIEAFPLVKRVSMQGCSNLTAEDLIHIMRKIADDDVELSVNLRPEDSL